MTATSTIHVREIHCNSCENTIQTALANCDGVYRVTPSAETNQVKVSYNEAIISEGELRLKLTEISYETVV